MSQPLSERLSVLTQYLLPKQALTALAGRFAGWQGGGVTTAAIERFVRRYGVNMGEAANPDVGSYSSFNEFLPARYALAPVLWPLRLLSARWTVRSASAAELRGTAFSRPRATATPRRLWWGGMPNWLRNLRAENLPPST